MTDKTVQDLREGDVLKPLNNFKVAICVSGKLRNFRHTAEFLRRYVIEPLNADVFLYVSSSSTPDEDDTDIIKLYNPINYIIDNQVIIPNPVYSYNKRPEVSVFSIVNQFYKIYKCNELKKEHEYKTGVKYDIVIRLRTDCFFERSFTEYELNNTKVGDIIMPTYWHFKDVNSFALTDMFAISNSNIINKYSEIYLRLDEYCQSCIFHPESLMGYHLTVINNFKIIDTVSPFFFEYPVDWVIPNGYNRETYRQAF